MCLLNLNNPAKQCTHSECQHTPNSNIFNSYFQGHYSEPTAFRPEDKKRAPIQSISEILAENILKKIKDDSGHAHLEKEKRNNNYFYDHNAQITPEAFYFQNQILLLMNQEMQAISETSNAIDKTFVQMKFLQKEINKTKEIFTQDQKKIAQNKIKAMKQEAEKYTVSPLLFIPKPGKTINKQQLLIQLYGQNREFKYQIKLNSELDTPFYRERNFRFSVALYDNQNNKISNSNRIPLALALYTSESMPKIIETNTIGIPILKGSIEKDLVNGVAEFEKLQIKEVTSHFRNGWIFFIVYAKMPSIFSKNNKIDKKSTGLDVDFMDIKPFILENVMVKAKKMKSSKDKDVKMEEKNGEISFQESNSKSADEEDKLVLSEKE